MKKENSLLFVFMIILFTSCRSPYYFQVFNTAPTGDMKVSDELLIYEDLNCMVSYDLWGQGGNIGFQFYNKTDENIYLKLDESFFVLNGISFNYFQDRTFTTSKTTGVTSSSVGGASESVTGFNFMNLVQTNKISAARSVRVKTSTDYSVSYKEEKIVCIPSKTSKQISEYVINESPLRDCDLFRYPKKWQIRTKKFSREQSPLVFSNRITYTVGRKNDLIKFENEFYVKEVSNYPEKEMYESKYEEFCGQKVPTKQKYFKNAEAKKFYIKYAKRKDFWKH